MAHTFHTKCRLFPCIFILKPYFIGPWSPLSRQVLKIRFPSTTSPPPNMSLKFNAARGIFLIQQEVSQFCKTILSQKSSNGNKNILHYTHKHYISSNSCESSLALSDGRRLFLINPDFTHYIVLNQSIHGKISICSIIIITITPCRDCILSFVIQK